MKRIKNQLSSKDILKSRLSNMLSRRLLWLSKNRLRPLLNLLQLQLKKPQQLIMPLLPKLNQLRLPQLLAQQYNHQDMRVDNKQRQERSKRKLTLHNNCQSNNKFRKLKKNRKL